MKTIPEDILSCFVEACREIGSRGLVKCSSGNVSCRIDAEHMLATASRSWLETLTEEDVVLCKIEDGSALNDKTPTVEAGFHAGILKERPDVNVIVHFQTPCATTLSCQQKDDIDYNVIIEIPFYIGPVAHVPCLMPGSKELSDAVIEVMKDHDMVMLANHGQVTVARDFDLAIQNAEFFELACEIILKGGPSVRPVTPEVVEELAALRNNLSESAV